MSKKNTEKKQDDKDVIDTGLISDDNEESEDESDIADEGDEGDEGDDECDIISYDENAVVDDDPVDEQDKYFSSDYFVEVKIIPDDERYTSDFMTLYEFTSVLGIRTQQISKDGQSYIESNDMTPKETAIKELYEKKCPLKIRRVVGDRVEIWGCNELTIPF